MQKPLTIVWALLIGVILVVLGAAALLPSTKRGSFDLEEYHRRREESARQERATTAPTTPTTPTTQPATAPATRPAGAASLPPQ